MAPRFDTEQRTLRLSVADLLARRAGVGPGMALRGGMERLWLGQAIHGRYQEQALADDLGYRREVPLAREIEHAGWRARVSGRADGLRRAPDGALVVEEIKSFRRGGAGAALARALACAQARVYSWIAAGAEPHVRAELVWIELGSDRVEREPLDVDLPAIEAEVRAEVALLLSEREEDQRGREARRLAAAELRFPHAEPRPQQRAIAAAVEKALEQREHLLVQAATGTGKTAAALFPALRFALENDRRVFVLTAKTTQQEMALRVLDALSPSRAFRSLRLRAKARMCANDELLCHEDWCRYLADFTEKLSGTGVVEGLLGAEATLLPDAIFAAGRANEVCPFELSLVLSRRAQAVVCDYNYVFDPYVALSEFGPDADPGDAILVIDEVHNLIERGRDYHSPALASSTWRGVARFAAELGAVIGTEIETVGAELAARIESAVDAAAPDGAHGSWAAEAALPEEDLFALRARLDRAFVDYLEHRTRTRTLRAEDPFVAAYFELLRFLGALARPDPSRARFVERSAREARLRVLCRDPGHFLGAILERCHSAIGLSATLAPLDFHRALLGFDVERTASLVVPDPFPRENRRVVIDASVGTALRERAANYGPIAARLAAFADAVPGNCMALFPSYAFLTEVAKRLAPARKRVLVQRPDDTEREREAILGVLRGALAGDALLLAVCGGAFAEGVDYPNGALRAVAVVGPALPALSPERDLLRAWFEERFERGFEHAYVVPGMTRVVQAAGRLIRSERDRGVIALFDHRFLEPPFRELLPPEWIPSEGVESLAGDAALAAREFFAPE